MATLPAMQGFDVVIVGAGAAGLFCAGVAGQLGQRVLLIDHAPKVAEKIRISGGGRANFTNRDLDPRAPQKHYLGENPHFCRSALSRYTPTDFTALLQRHSVPFHEKHKGQLFCDRSAEDLINVLLRECEAGGVTRWQPCAVKTVAHGADGYTLDTANGSVRAPALVVATGGLPIPKIGATDWGLRIARQFDLPVVPTRPALVPLTFDEHAWGPFAELAGLALPVHIETGETKGPHAPPLRGSLPPEGERLALGRPGGKATKGAFDEDLLFTHRGLSGPAVLQISSYWREGQPLRLDLLPGVNLLHTLTERKLSSRRLLANELSSLLPSRLADTWAAQDPLLQRPMNEVPDKALARLAEGLQRWQLTPTGTEGYRKAEVMAGGVDTKTLSSQTMESKQPGLYFIGEVVDVTGWLGGYNFQWAWASGFACAQALAARS